jgi:hypothetical protein
MDEIEWTPFDDLHEGEHYIPDETNQLFELLMGTFAKELLTGPQMGTEEEPA